MLIPVLTFVHPACQTANSVPHQLIVNNVTLAMSLGQDLVV